LVSAFFTVFKSSRPLPLSSSKMGIFGRGKKADDKPVTAPEQKIINEDKVAEGDVGSGSAEVVEAVPGSFEITLEKAALEDTLGATLVHPDGKQLTVKALKEKGLIVDWNAKNESTPALKLYPNDLIINVNGVKDDASAMVDQLKKVGPITLRVVHGKDYAPAPAEDAVEPPVKPAEDTTVEPEPPKADAPAEDGPEPPKTYPPAEEPEPPKADQAPAIAAEEIAPIENDPGEMKGEDFKFFTCCG